MAGWMKWEALWLLLIGIVSVIVCVHDKRAAKRGAWRVPESTLLLLGLLGGALPMLATMLLIRHKTRHIMFMLGLPLEILLQAVIFILLFRRTA